MGSIKRGFLIFSIFLSSISVSCWYYSFSGSIPSHIKSVAIPLFEDRTSEYLVKEKLTNALMEKFIDENILKIVDRKNADSIIFGEITGVRDEPYTYDENERVQEYKVNIYIEIKWMDVRKNKTIFEDKMVGWGIYSAETGSPQAREEGPDEAIEKLAADIINRTVSGW
ncbi:MAG: LptE family protein [Fidelibacterota bacterium]